MGAACSRSLSWDKEWPRAHNSKQVNTAVKELQATRNPEMRTLPSLLADGWWMALSDASGFVVASPTRRCSA